MDASYSHATTAPAHMPARRLLGAYLQEARSESLRYLREPAFMLPMILFPAVFYLLFGVLMGERMGGGHYDMGRHLLASYSTFGVMAPGLFGFGVSLALERGGGLLTFKRAVPMPPAAYLLAKMVMAMLVAAIVTALLTVLALVLAKVSLAPSQIAALLVTGTLGVLPFCAMGMWIGTLIKGQGAPGAINLVYLPMAFLSGLWVPLQVLPQTVRQIAPVWPSYHLNRLTLDAVGMQSTTWWPHVLVLCAFTAVFLLLAARRLRRHG